MQKRNRIFRWFIALVLTISTVTAGILPVSAAAAAFTDVPSDAIYAESLDNQYILPVFETSDIHGYIAEKAGDDYQYLLSYISDKVKDVRGYGDAYNKDSALLLDGGDIFQGNSMSNLMIGDPISSAFAMMDYDAATIGNHEFDWGIDTVIDGDGTMKDSNLEGYAVDNTVPFVASNLYQNESRADWTSDYVILTKTAKNADGQTIPVKIGVIGYVDDYAHSIMESKFLDLGYSIRSDVSIPDGIAKELEDSGKVDATILLCHADAKETAEQLGSDSVIDLVLGGHSHLIMNDIASNGIPYMEPNNNAKAYCSADLVFQNESAGTEFITVSNRKIQSVSDHLDKTLKTEANTEELDNDIVKLTDTVVDKMKDLLNTTIGYITTSAQKYELIENSGNKSTTGGNWMSSIYLRGVNSDVAFVNLGAVRYSFDISPDAAKRDVTLEEIYTNYPFGNFIYKYSLTYEELLEVLNYALKDEEGSSIGSLIGIDCYFIDEEVNAIVKDGIVVYQNGEWKDNWKDKKVTVATNEYVGTADKVFQGIHNPLVRFNDTPKLLEKSRIDVDCAIEVLKKEAFENNGLLTIDRAPHFIEAIYDHETACPGRAFDDLDSSQWYHEGTDFVISKGIMNGTGDNTFEPMKATTRAMIVTMLWRMEGSPQTDGSVTFTDVPDGQWYTDAIKWAASNDIVNGYDEDTFGTNDSVTREQLATILYRSAQAKGMGFTGSWAFPLNYNDADQVSDWADKAMHWMVMTGVMNGVSDKELSPKSDALRAQVATMLMRFSEIVS